MTVNGVLKRFENFIPGSHRTELFLNPLYGFISGV